MTQQQLMASAANVFALGGGGPPPDFDWIDVWDGAGGQAALAGFANKTFRIRVPKAAFLGVTGTKVRVTFKAGTDDMTIGHAWFGNAASAAGTDQFDFASTPEALTFNTGDPDITVGAGTTELSDGIDFDVDGLHDLMIAFHNVDSAAPWFLFASNQEGVRGFLWGGSGDDSDTVDTSFYSARVGEVQYAIVGMVKLEIWGETGTPVGPGGTYPASLGLINPGAELGDTTGWTSILGSSPQLRATTDDGINSNTGSFHFAMAASAAEAKWYQDFDLTALGDWTNIETDIANGFVKALFGGFTFSPGGGESDTCAPFIVALDSVGDPLQFRYLLEVHPVAGWVKRLVPLFLPPGTETLRVGWIGTRLNGTQLSCYIDDMTLDLVEVAPTAPDPFSDLVIFHLTADDTVDSDAALSPLPFTFHGGLTRVDPGDGNYVIEEVGTGDSYVDYTENLDALFYLRKLDFTLEGFLTWATATPDAELFSHHGNGAFFGRQSFIFGIEDGLYYMRLWDNILGEIRIDADTAITVDTRQHVVFQRSGSVIQILLDGVEVASGTFANAVQDGFSFEARNIVNGQNNDGFRADDWRFTKGVGRYPSSFTPPAVLERPNSSGADVNAHQFYRINITANNGDATYGSPGMVEFYEGYDRVNQCRNGSTISNKAGAFGNIPDNSFNGLYSGRFVDTMSGGLWIGYRLTTPKNINGVQMRAYSNQGSQNPSAFDFDHSDDGHEWTTRWSESSISYVDEGDWKGMTFWNPAYDPGTYSGSPRPATVNWRIVMLVHAADTFSTAEIEMASTPAGADECNGGTAITDDASFGTSAANAFDNNNSSLYAPSNSPGHWIGYTLPAAVAMEEYRWRSRSDSAAGQNPLRSAMEFTLDGANWNTAWEGYNGASWTLGEVRTFADPLYV